MAAWLHLPSGSVFVLELSGSRPPRALAQRALAPTPRGSFPCRPQSCSPLIPSPPADDPTDNDCAYRNGNEWWLDYVAGSLAWSRRPSPHPVTVAVFDDGAAVDYSALRNRPLAH